jgi:thioredoxin-dependent peroxiredoxin
MSFRGIIKLLFRGKPTMLEPGQKAPDFTAVDHHGNEVRLSDLRGSKIVLWFYPKANTSG